MNAEKRRVGWEEVCVGGLQCVLVQQQENERRVVVAAAVVVEGVKG